jgi:nickel-type superoxide dismutase maturation protease
MHRDDALDGRGPWVRVAVAGDSMSPALADGDWLLCRRLREGRRPRVGDVVVVRRPDRDLLLVKRVVRREPEGWWVEGDNSARSDDSRVFGVVPDRDVVARVLLRYAPRPALVR